MPAGAWAAAARALRDEPGLAFDSLMCLSGLDLSKYPGEESSPDLAVVYHLHSMSRRARLAVRVRAPRDAARVPSVAGVWPVAGFFEREAFDLFGIAFEGHPDLRRILLPEDWTGHPGRKDYVRPESYGGVTHAREGQAFVAAKGGAK